VPNRAPAHVRPDAGAQGIQLRLPTQQLPAHVDIGGIAGISGASELNASRRSAPTDAVTSAALLPGAVERGGVRPGLLNMLKQPAHTPAPDSGGRSLTSVALRVDASKPRGGDADDTRAPATDAMPPGPLDALPVSGKAFLEAAKRMLDKAEYAQARARRVFVAAMRNDARFARAPQFQSMLKSHKAETLSFEALLAGTICATIALHVTAR